MDQWLQIVGAVMILAAFVAVQFHVLEQDSYRYLLLNVAGSAILAVLAFQGQQWGFLLLEGVWALVSLWGIFVHARERPPAR